MGLIRYLQNLADGLAKTLWLGNPKIALYSVAFVDNWHWWGFIMVLFLGALQQVDSELYEAARVDGANRFQELCTCLSQGIRPTIAFVLIMTIMWSFLTFDYVLHYDERRSGQCDRDYVDVYL